MGDLKDKREESFKFIGASVAAITTNLKATLLATLLTTTQIATLLTTNRITTLLATAKSATH
jgi:hypothetical protein